MRMSLMGGGSDLSVYYRREYGAVIGTALDRYIYITVNKKFDEQIRVSYSSTELVGCVDDVKHNIIREALKMTGICNGIEVVYMGDIPLGSAGVGLGSSSSLAVGVLNALYAFKGKHVSAETLARQACEIEIKHLKNPIGKQDQYMAAYGGMNYIRFNADESVFVDPVICSGNTKKELQKKLLLFYTGVTRISSHILEEQNKNIDTNYAVLDQLVEMAQELRDIISADRLTFVGKLLHDSWLLKKKLASGVTTTFIDDLYERALNAGAVGGKVLGAGGGGFLLLYCEPDAQGSVVQALSEVRRISINFEAQGSKIIYVSD